MFNSRPIEKYNETRNEFRRKLWDFETWKGKTPQRRQHTCDHVWNKDHKKCMVCYVDM